MTGKMECTTTVKIILKLFALSVAFARTGTILTSIYKIIPKENVEKCIIIETNQECVKGLFTSTTSNKVSHLEIFKPSKKLRG
jgi:hypothetical protein